MIFGRAEKHGRSYTDFEIYWNIGILSVYFHIAAKNIGVNGQRHFNVLTSLNAEKFRNIWQSCETVTTNILKYYLNGRRQIEIGSFIVYQPKKRMGRQKIASQWLLSPVKGVDNIRTG